MTLNRAELVNWRAELQNNTIGLNMPKDARDTNRLPDDELFDNPVGRTLPCAPLPTIETPFGQSLYPLSLRRLWQGSLSVPIRTSTPCGGLREVAHSGRGAACIHEGGSDARKRPSRSQRAMPIRLSVLCNVMRKEQTPTLASAPCRDQITSLTNAE